MRRKGRLRIVTVILFELAASHASAQLDPLLFLKATKPNVLVALDLSSRMQRDAHGTYYDPLVFERMNDAFEASLGVTSLTTDRAYRRRYIGLDWAAPGGEVRAAARAVQAVGDRDPAFAAFDALNRLGRVSLALRRVVGGNAQSVRFGLLSTRQAAPRIDTTEWAVITAQAPGTEQPTDTGTAGRWRTGIPRVDDAGTSVSAGQPIIAADSATASLQLGRLLELRTGSPGALLPAGFDTPLAIDAPLSLLLDDLRAEASRLVAADTACRNTIAVLIASGSDRSAGPEALGNTAATFLAIQGRRVPIYVIALAPDAGDVDQLQEVATRSGGQYFEITAEMIDRVAVDEPVPEICRALNLAVQHAFATFADFNTPPTASRPHGPSSLFPTAGPVVGTVNLENAVDAGGAVLPATRILGPRGESLPQRSNVLFTAGFELPGFRGRLDALRVYRPIADATQLTGYRFVADGTRLWTARTPPADQRNLFTVLPGRGLVPLRASNAAALALFLGVPDPVRLIEAVRSLPLGAITLSTPALLEPPSMPFADPDYQAFAEANRGRRAIVFVGADDGMLHAIDARTGIEVWAVVPFNLLPRLRLLPGGAPIDAFPYGVGGAPRLADVRVLGAWRTFLVFGEGPGGTFYQAIDVTLDGIAAAVPADADPVPALLAWFAAPHRVAFRWSYPRYEQFDPALGPYGDLAASATESEKSVGETWSTPTVGRFGTDGPFVLIVGSGNMPRSRERLAQRGGTRAGTRLYMLDAATGVLRDSRDVGSDGLAEDEEGCASGDCSRLKNALHADPLAVGSPGQVAMTRVYEGDLDGRLWRFDLAAGPGPPAFAGPPRLLLAAGASQPVFGSIAMLAGNAGQSYLFLGTGSDLLPRAGVAAGYHFLGVSEAGGGVVRQFDRSLRTVANGGVDEAVTGAPAVAGSVVFFTTSGGGAGGRCESPEISLYALNVAGGVAYDVNGDRRRDSGDDAVVFRSRTARATGPLAADRHLFVATGDRVQVFGDPEGFNAGPGLLGIRAVSWREVR